MYRIDKFGPEKIGLLKIRLKIYVLSLSELYSICYNYTVTIKLQT